MLFDILLVLDLLLSNLRTADTPRLRTRYARLGLPRIDGKFQPLDNSLDDAYSVGAVCNAKAFLDTDEVSVGDEVSAADRMEGAQDQLRFNAIAKQLCNPLLHLPRALDGKGEAYDVPWLVFMMSQEVGNARRKCLGFAAPWGG